MTKTAPQRLGVELALPRLPGRTKASGPYKGIAALCLLCRLPLYGFKPGVRHHGACVTRERLARYAAMLKRPPGERTKNRATRRRSACP